MLLDCGVEKTLEISLDFKEIQPVHPKGDPSWVFTGRSDVEAEAPILWPPDAKSWLIGIDPNAGKDWGQKEKRTTEDKMVGWHHRLDGHGFQWTLGACDGQGGLACYGSWGRKELDTTQWLNRTEWQLYFQFFEETSHCSPQWWHPIYIPTNSVLGFPFLHLHILANNCNFFSFWW